MHSIRRVQAFSVIVVVVAHVRSIYCDKRYSKNIYIYVSCKYNRYSTVLMPIGGSYTTVRAHSRYTQLCTGAFFYANIPRKVRAACTMEKVIIFTNPFIRTQPKCWCTTLQGVLHLNLKIVYDLCVKYGKNII